MPGIRVDGNDLLAVFREVQRAVERARSGGGPTFLELVTFRMGGHSSADDPTRYRNESEVEHWTQRCPLARYRTYLEDAGLWDEAKEEALAAELREEINAAVKEAERAELPPPVSMTEDVYADDPPALEEQRATLLDELGEQNA
mgnify:FL=1